jgi:SAM-dependent methyltransferase
MAEIDLFKPVYPERKRDWKAVARNKTEQQVEIARKYGWEYFDMKGICYGSYSYDGRWVAVARRFIEHYGLRPGMRVLDIGCAKGYLLYDFLHVMPSLVVAGIDISQFAVNCCPPEVAPFLRVGNANNLSMFGDQEFDLVLSISTVHNLPESECRQAIREIQRVGKHAWVKVDSYRNEEEKEIMFAWNITARTILSANDWKSLFLEEGYTGDYYWTLPGQGY